MLQITILAADAYNPRPVIRQEGPAGDISSTVPDGGKAVDNPRENATKPLKNGQNIKSEILR
jgi:hypothetical protein